MIIPKAQLHHLLAATRYAARDVLLIQGSGGNSSVKSPDGKRLWVKASGLRMTELDGSKGYVGVDVEPWLEALRNPQGAEPAMPSKGGGLRPSMEAGFHAALGPVVLHTHPVYVNAFSCMAGGHEALEDVAPAASIWIGYRPPGMDLAREVFRVCRERTSPGDEPLAIVLANHGFIASGHDADQVIDITRKFDSAGRSYFGELPAELVTQQPPSPELARWAQELQSALDQRLPGQVVALPARWPALHRASEEPERWLTLGPLVPDDVVYGPEKVFCLGASTSAQKWADNFPDAGTRAVVAVEGLGLVLVAGSRRLFDTMEENLLANVLIRFLMARRGRPLELPEAQAAHLRTMESEKYRQALVAGRG